jgi:hypothetical protein
LALARLSNGGAAYARSPVPPGAFVPPPPAPPACREGTLLSSRCRKVCVAQGAWSGALS